VGDPPAALLAWAGRTAGGPARVERGLRDGGNPWLIRVDVGGATRRVVLKTVADSPGGAAAEAAALAIAAAHAIPTPELVGVDRDGAVAGLPTVLESVVPGTSRIPRLVGPARLRAAGAVVGRLGRIALAPSADLPRRHRPIPAYDFAAERRSGRAPSSAVLDAAAEVLARRPAPPGPSGLVHGDIWHGNLMWSGDRVTGIIDWETAGTGDAGVDLGALRLDAAIMFGAAAAETVLTGWLAGREAPLPAALARWDVVAASNTPTDMALFVPVIHGQGRSDLDAATLNARRDAFLDDALRRLVRDGG
jgi:aminoglycoside phosphotransferase (APT) family kinase protein